MHYFTQYILIVMKSHIAAQKRRELRYSTEVKEELPW